MHRSDTIVTYVIAGTRRAAQPPRTRASAGIRAASLSTRGPVCRRTTVQSSLYPSPAGHLYRSCVRRVGVWSSPHRTEHGVALLLYNESMTYTRGGDVHG